MRNTILEQNVRVPLKDQESVFVAHRDHGRPCPLSIGFREGLFYDPEVAERVGRHLGTADPTALLPVENLVHLLRTYSRLSERLNALLAPHDLSLAKFNLLAILFKYAPENRLPMSEIGERMSVTCANITKLVDALERQGLVQRTSLPGDRRVVLAELTPDGKALMQRLMPEHYANIRHLWTGMSEADCRQLTHLLLQLQQSLLAAEEPEVAHTQSKKDSNAP
jgi:MarR family 2-MHQ and catechol resistance regulon transcriptional repressor